MICKFDKYIFEFYEPEIPFDPPVEKISPITITPNKSRSSGMSKELVYLTSSKSYAQAYANGQTSAAHVFGRGDIENGVLFYVALSDNDSHYGGDIWTGGFKDDIIDNLTDYIKDSDGTQLERLTEEVLSACGIEPEDVSKKTLREVVKNFKKDDLSWMSVSEWSRIQDAYQGYSEICVKSVEFNEIIKIEVFKDGDLVNVIKGGKDIEIDEEYQEDEFGNPIFYHGSPLKFWEKLLLR